MLCQWICLAIRALNLSSPLLSIAWGSFQYCLGHRAQLYSLCNFVFDKRYSRMTYEEEKRECQERTGHIGASATVLAKADRHPLFEILTPIAAKNKQALRLLWLQISLSKNSKTQRVKWGKSAAFNRQIYIKTENFHEESPITPIFVHATLRNE